MRAKTVGWCLGGAMLLVAVALAGEGTRATSEESKPPWQRLLQGEDAKKAAKLQGQIDERVTTKKWADAVKAAQELAALREARQGKDHWQTEDARFQVSALQRVQAAPQKKRDGFAEYPALVKRATQMEAKGRHAATLPLRRKILDVCRDLLGEEHPSTVTSYIGMASNQNAQGKYREAEGGLRKALAIQRKVLGEEHPSTALSYNNLAYSQDGQGKYTEAEEGYSKALAIRRKVLGEEHPDTALSYNNLAINQQHQGKYKEAEGGFRKALAISRKVLGEEHFSTATSYSGLAVNQNAQGKHKDAEGGFRKALAICRKVLGEEHPYTALSYNNLAYIQQAQGKYKEAEGGLRKALAIQCKVLGEEHSDTALSYNNLAYNQAVQGNYKEGEEGYRKALAIQRKVRGEEHPYTASSYNNLAYIQQAQGKYKEAEVGLRKALAIRRKVQGEEHPDTALSYIGLASNQAAQGKYKEAEGGFRKALAISYKVQGEEHPSTAYSYNGLANNQQVQGKYKDAEVGFRKALAIRRKVLGEEHPDTATSYNNLASNQNAQGKYKEAEGGYSKALAIKLKVLGEEHPDTAMTYNNLALNQNAQGKYKEAEELATKAADIFARTRLQIAATGLDRATITGKLTPLPLLVAMLARNGKPAAAWQRFEESLGRGTGDDFAARLKRPAKDRQQQSELLASLRLLEGKLQKLAAVKKPGVAEEAQRENLLGELRKQQDALAQLARELEEKFGPVQGQVFDVATLQKTLPADAAFLGWIDLTSDPKAADPNGEHWGILLKAKGAPVLVRLPGTGDKGIWTKPDDDLAAKLRQALISASSDWQDLARRLRVQRLSPLADHLKGVRQLIVLPSTKMDGIPVEVIAGDLTVSYSPSASLFAYQKQQARPKSQGLVALGDPNFRYPRQPELPLPPGGVLLTAVLPGSAAASNGLKSGDVLLAHGETAVNSLVDLQKAIAASDKGARIKVWRLAPGESKARELTLSVPAGKWGVVIAREPAPKALAAQRKTDTMLASRDGTDWKDLPGTRYEVSALAKLFAAEKPTVLLGSDACESSLDDLARAGTLKRARYVHLATHGEARTDKPLASRIILSRDRLNEGQDGELTAEQVLRGWQLDAELVTLSACQTGLGTYSHGEGFLGFAQALLLTGSRSVCLSRWSVNDLSTALLMERFYQNLLGKRSGLKAPLGKAAALAEAKAWLRTLPRAEALKRAEAIGVGVARGPGARELPRLSVPEGPKEKSPYAHPYYWAGFVLVGDRD